MHNAATKIATPINLVRFIISVHVLDAPNFPTIPPSEIAIVREVGMCVCPPPRAFA